MSHSTSIVPIVLWGKTPPTHLISVVTCTYDQRTVISGTSDGQIGLWDLRMTKDSGLRIVPRNLIFAHGSGIVDIACALDASFEKPNIISLSSEGELCLWDIEDGLCIQTNNIPGKHRRLQSVQVTKGSLREWRILLCGLYCDIYVLDTASLEIIYTLKSRIAPDWITCLCTLRSARHQEEKLVALTASNVLKVWKLKASYEKRRPEVVYEQESKSLDCLKAKSMCCNPFTQRTILVLSSKAWQIFDSSDYSFIALIPSPYKQTLAGGDFVAANRVLIWDKSGRAYLYKLPSKYLLGAEGMEQATSDKGSRAPVLICLFDINNLKVNFGAPMYFSYGRRGPFFKLLFQGTSNGSIHVWKVPDSEQADESLAIGQTSATELVSTEATVLNEGVRMTVMIDELWTMKMIPSAATMSLKELWKESKPIGLIDGVAEECAQARLITATLYLSSQGLIVCGRKDGSIVVINAVRAALNQLLEGNQTAKADHLPLNILKGHTGKVTCLLYPNEENPRYDITHLVSGGADFTVRLWDVFNGSLLHTFNSQGGEVVKLLVTPPDCTARFLSCICSVAQDHSVALLGIRERKTLLLASRHTFPVETIRWRAKDDFMVIGCADGTVYVWQMETGHLDRCVAGSVAYDILESCCEETSSPTAAVREYRHKFRLQSSLSAMRHQLPLEFSTPAIVKKVRKKITHMQSSNNQKNVAPQQESRQPPNQTQLPPIRVCALRSNRNDSDVHVMLLDPEALICQLLAEDAEAASTHGKPVNPKRHPSRGLSQIPVQDQRKSIKTSMTSQIQREVSHEMAQLLLSCIHSWGIDPTLDETCTARLGMLKPVDPLSFGLLTRGRLSLMLPNWKIDESEDTSSHDSDETQSQMYSEDDPSFHRKLRFNSHWQLSSSLTTQHLLSIVSITNTLMSMNHISFVNQVKGGVDEESLSDYNQVSQQRAEEKAGWSLVAALHCCLLPEMMRGFMYRPPLLHILARRWQDRCLEIREAVQAILLAELRRVGTKGRKQLIDAWSPHLPQDIDSTDFGFEDLEQYMNSEEDKPMVITADEDKADVAMVMLTTKKMVSSDVRLRHATAIVMLGVIGAEFQKEVDPLALPRDQKGHLSSEGMMEVTTLRYTAKALTSLLLQRPTTKAPAYSAIRRAAIDLIGRGFALWEPHIDVSHVLIGLLDLCANTSLVGQEHEYFSSVLSAPADLHRSAKHALGLIATARPAAFITTLAKEVARHVANASSISFNQTSPAAIAVYSHVRHQPVPATPDSQNSNVIHSARSEILRTIELMIEKNQQDVIHLIVEVADVVVHCLDHKIVKDKGLAEVFPAICRFNMVSYCGNTRRLAVGSRLGHIALYELRSSRCQLIPAHSSSINALAFSPEGKILASFSYDDGKISFWQTSTSLLGLLSSTVKCVHTYKTSEMKNCPPMAIKQVRLVWINHKNVVILTGDNKQFKFSV